MERRDYERSEKQRYNYNTERFITVDASTTEFSGTRREADLIVRGLKLLQAELLRCEAVGLVLQDAENIFWNDKSLGRAPNRQELDEIIEAVEAPHYIVDDGINSDDTYDQPSYTHLTTL